jgi:hypothetical protein
MVNEREKDGKNEMQLPVFESLDNSKVIKTDITTRTLKMKDNQISPIKYSIFPILSFNRQHYDGLALYKRSIKCASALVLMGLLQQ